MKTATDQECTVAEDRAARPETNARPKKAALAFVFITVVLDMLALGVIVPVLPGLVVSFVHGNTARGAEVLGLFGTLWATMQFLFSPMMGSLSDRFGRRPVILISNFGLGLDYFLMAMAPTLWWLLVGRVISGITSASTSAAGAYIADVTPAEKRAAAFGMLSVAFGLGFVMGPAIGGFLGEYHARLPFWVAGGLSILNAMYGFFVLPESLPRQKRMSFAWRRANPIGSIGLLRSHRELLGLTTVNFIGNVVHEAYPTIFVLYAMYRYGWGDRAVGLTIATVGVSSAIVGGALVQPVVARFGERRTMLMGLIFGALGFAITGFAPTGLIFWIGVPINALWGLYGPPMQGLMTRRVSATEQGQLQGAQSSVRGIAMMLGPGIFTGVLAAAIGRWREWNVPGAPFILAAIMLVGAIVVARQVTSLGEEAGGAIAVEAAS
jgi:DHA1 family tetracycline resistance protein-like MFS transporter